MKVIQIRGVNASGKTTAVRLFIEKNKMKPKIINVGGKPTPIVVNDDESIVVIGPYSEKTGGCDRFSSKKYINETILTVIKAMNPETIIWECFIHSTTFNMGREQAEMLKNYGYEYKTILLDIDPKTALKRLYLRNGGSKINEENLYNKVQMCQRALKKFEASGIETKTVDTTRMARQDMWKIIDEAIQ